MAIVVSFRERCCAKTTFAESHGGRSLSYGSAGPFIHHALGHDLILDEVKRNLVAAGRLTPDRGDYLVAEMTRAFPSAAVVGFETLIPCMTNDEKDRHVSAAAVRARAEVIVASNLRDFSDEALAPYGITAKAPDEFLLDLTSLSGRTMARIVREQLADIAASDPTATMDMLFEALTRHAPGFVDTIRSILDAQEAP